MMLDPTANGTAKDGKLMGSITVSGAVLQVDHFLMAEMRLVVKMAHVCLNSADKFETQMEHVLPCFAH